MSEEYKLVPWEPTEAMLHAADMKAMFVSGETDMPRALWQAMIAAAPSSGGGEPVAWRLRDGNTERGLFYNQEVAVEHAASYETVAPLYAHPGKALSVEEVARIIRDWIAAPDDVRLRAVSFKPNDDLAFTYIDVGDRDCREAAQAILAAMGRTGE